MLRYAHTSKFTVYGSAANIIQLSPLVFWLLSAIADTENQGSYDRELAEYQLSVFTLNELDILEIPC